MESWFKIRKTGIFVLLAVCLLGGCESRTDAPVDMSGLVQSAVTPSPSPEIAKTPVPTMASISAPTVEPAATPIPGEYDFTVCFAGDINLAEGAVTTERMDSSENGIYDCISPELMECMNQADIFCLNNEFTYSLRGEPLPGKAYTFRANPARAEVLLQLGVDIVSLANNHVFDYGEDAITDTFDTLQEFDISYFGAGTDLEAAMQPIYMTVDDKVIAFVGASRAEKNKMTPQATENSPGILRCYDTELFLQVIKEADANADFMLAYVHWGTEYSHELEEVQLITGKEYLDAGADVIIGAHSHCLQGMEYYGEKPIIYSLGNFWFNSRTLDTMLVQLHFWGNDGQGNLEVKVIPAVQKDAQTYAVTDEKEKERIFDFLEEISVNVEIDAQGVVKPR